MMTPAQMAVERIKGIAGPQSHDARYQRGYELAPGLASQVQSEYAAIAPYDLAVIDSRSDGVSDGRKLEFYPPGEADNPLPGRATVQVFDPSFEGADLSRMVAADFTHYLPHVDPKFAGLRNRMAASMTPFQDEINQRAYGYAQDGTYSQGGPVETRPYDEWFDRHRLDQFMGAGFLPKDGHSTMQTFQNSDYANWMRLMSPEQHGLLSEIEGYMRTGQ